MDHFLLPEGKAHLRVPNLTTQEYIRGDGDFKGYPSRMKWRENSFGGRRREQLQAFFQSWLFFGCAIEVLAIAHVKAEQADFLDETGQYVSTRQLSRFLCKSAGLGMSDMGIDGHYYLARLKPGEDEVSHGNCTQYECCARNVDKDTYK
ncbi:hypothetical protein QQZ08_009692 [Neonectria magnoliae]|uniref:Uncharacterized protein n=1 Tax=Neonectria magnoliae TaxID=2732573 RepID=A0ABR1HL69_9HYPO